MDALIEECATPAQIWVYEPLAAFYLQEMEIGVADSHQGDLAQVSLMYHVYEFVIDWIKTLGEILHIHHAGGTDGLLDAVAILQSGRHRLFAQDVNAGCSCLFNQGCVLDCFCGDPDRITFAQQGCKV